MTITPEILIEIRRLIICYISTSHLKHHKTLKAASYMVDDIIQDICVQLILYPPDLTKYKFSTIIINLLKHRLSYLYHKNKALKNTPRKEDKIFLIKSHIYEESYNEEIKIDMSYLHKRERCLIKMHYGIGCPARTLSSIAQRYGLSRGRIHQLIQKALDRLNKYGLSSFDEK